MNEIFGVPADTLATVLAVLLAAGLAAVAALALRNPILLKLGLRNMPRRRARSALIVVGLMLGTAIIAAALATGDTMARPSARTSCARSGRPTSWSPPRGPTPNPSGIRRSVGAGALAGFSAYERVRDAAAESASWTALHRRFSRRWRCGINHATERAARDVVRQRAPRARRLRDDQRRWGECRSATSDHARFT